MDAPVDHDLLVRIDERTKTITESMAQFVTRQEFKPVKSIVYGMVALILVGVFGAILALVVVNGGKHP